MSDVKDFPKSSFDWHAMSFKDADWWRATADQWEALGNSAEVDGDDEHAKRHREEAARCRDVARRKELFAELNASTPPPAPREETGEGK
jgi:hypothetical protein